MMCARCGHNEDLHTAAGSACNHMGCECAAFVRQEGAAREGGTAAPGHWVPTTPVPLQDIARALVKHAAAAAACGDEYWSVIFRTLAQQVTTAQVEMGLVPSSPLSTIERGPLNAARAPTRARVSYSHLALIDEITADKLPIGPETAGLLVAEVRRLRTLISSLYRQLEGEVD